MTGVILALCSVGGVQSQSITVDMQMRRLKVARIYSKWSLLQVEFIYSPLSYVDLLLEDIVF